MKNYSLEDLISQFSGHAWEFGISHENDFNLPLALKNIIEELIEDKKKISQMETDVKTPSHKSEGF